MQKNYADIICIGDSITGWSQYALEERPYPTYPQFLQELLPNLTIANVGIAGAYSEEGIRHVQDAVERFPTARYFVIGYGTNDLGLSEDLEQTSRNIISNLEEMITLVRSQGIIPLLMNIPNVNESLVPPCQRAELCLKRDYHNQQLAKFCSRQNLVLADICSHLKAEDFADVLHPNETGAQKIAQVVHQILIGML